MICERRECIGDSKKDGKKLVETNTSDCVVFYEFIHCFLRSIFQYIQCIESYHIYHYTNEGIRTGFWFDGVLLRNSQLSECFGFKRKDERQQYYFFME